MPCVFLSLDTKEVIQAFAPKDQDSKPMEFQSLGFEFNKVAVTSFEPIFSRVFESINPKQSTLSSDQKLRSCRREKQAKLTLDSSKTYTTRGRCECNPEEAKVYLAKRLRPPTRLLGPGRRKRER